MQTPMAEKAGSRANDTSTRYCERRYKGKPCSREVRTKLRAPANATADAERARAEKPGSNLRELMYEKRRFEIEAGCCERSETNE